MHCLHLWYSSLTRSIFHPSTAHTKELELLNRIAALISTENELREKVHVSETEFGERLRVASMRERELQDQLLAAGREIDQKERLWQEKFTLCQDELNALRIQCTANTANTGNTSHTSTANSPVITSDTPPVRARQMLQNEVDSLRCVLQLKQQEIADLRKHNHELAGDAEALPAITVKAHALQSRIEDLQLQLEQKCSDELELRQKLRHAEKRCAHETSNRKNVTLDNEQLRWKLMQNSEKFSNTLSELSKHYPTHADSLAKAQHALENQSTSDLSGASFGARSSFGGSFSSSHTAVADLSPPSTPVVKGVVEKSESVSWVLEINDDESAEALASRIVRRAGSFRSHLGDRPLQQTPAKKRHTGGPNGEGNPLSQSASAASILRHYSAGDSAAQSPQFRRHKLTSTNSCSTAPIVGATAFGTGVGRMRSKSVSTASSTLASRAVIDHWIGKPICTSSPCRTKRSPREAPPVQEPTVQLLSDESEAEGSPKSNRARSKSLTITAAKAAAAALSAAANPSGQLSTSFVRRSNAANGATSGSNTSGSGSFRGSRGSKLLSVVLPQLPSSMPLPASSLSSAAAASAAPAAGSVRSDLLQSATASMQDSPKFQQIKESAGEAMVSGTNSEDDCDDDDDEDLLLDVEEASSTGSSDESMSVSSGRTTNSSHSHFVATGRAEQAKLRRVSLEDVLMHDIVESLGRSLDDNF